MRDTSSTHPSDESRMRGIFSLLNKMDPDLSHTELRPQWKEYIATPEKPDHYDFFYADCLLEELAQLIIIKLINSPWISFQSIPMDMLPGRKRISPKSKPSSFLHRMWMFRSCRSGVNIHRFFQTRSPRHSLTTTHS